MSDCHDYVVDGCDYEDAKRETLQAQREIKRLTAALERIAAFHGAIDLPKELQNGSPAAVRFYVAVEPIRIARATLTEGRST